MYLYVHSEGHYCMHHINYDLFYLQSVVPSYIDMIHAFFYKQCSLSTSASELFSILPHFQIQRCLGRCLFKSLQNSYKLPLFYSKFIDLGDQSMLSHLLPYIGSPGVHIV